MNRLPYELQTKILTEINNGVPMGFISKSPYEFAHLWRDKESNKIMESHVHAAIMMVAHPNRDVVMKRGDAYITFDTALYENSSKKLEAMLRMSTTNIGETKI